MRNLSQADFASLEAAHTAAGNCELHQVMDLAALNFYNSAKQTVPILIDLAQNAAEALRQAEADRTALANARMLVGRLVREWKETALAKRESGEPVEAEVYDRCCRELSSIGIEQAGNIKG